MHDNGAAPGRFGLPEAGIEPTDEVYWNLSPAELVEHAVSHGEGRLAASGAFTAVTAPHTGRSPQDRFVVKEPSTEADIWWGSVNVPMSPAHFEGLRSKLQEALGRQVLYVRDVTAGADPAYSLKVRVVTPSAWHNLFAANMFLPASGETASSFEPDWTVLHDPKVQADPEADGTRTSTFIVMNFAERVVLVGGTAYAGEIKKSIFAVMNHRLPPLDVFPMHCSANVGEAGDTALFFGLSGTGKTTLSADPRRRLIGDDEHGWSREGVFNFEGGCYAKVIRLSRENEPQIWAATERFGAIIENVVLDPVTRTVDYDSDQITENTRSSYPINYLDGIVPSGMAGHPKNVIFLTADAFGVLPPLSRLTREQAMVHFLSGYTARVAGTERGVTEPQGDLQHLLRRALPAPPPGSLRRDARPPPRRARRRCLAGEHRLDGRTLWRRKALPAPGDARHAERRAGGQPRRRADAHRSHLRAQRPHCCAWCGG